MFNTFFSFTTPQELTVLEIIDTAVKVGLGAIISGVATYLITKLQHKGNAEQEQRKRKAILLQEAAEQLENVNHVYLKYAALTNDALRIRHEGRKLPEKLKIEREQVKVEFFNIYKELTNAEAKLMLADEMGIGEVAREFGNKITEFKSKVIIKESPLSESEIDELKSGILETRKKLFKALANSYKRT